MYAFGNDAFESQQQPAMTMMQRLQMDRRKKIQEHQMRVMKGNIFCIVFYLIKKKKKQLPTEISTLN
jgi:hypothetical protein